MAPFLHMAQEQASRPLHDSPPLIAAIHNHFQKPINAGETLQWALERIPRDGVEAQSKCAPETAARRRTLLLLRNSFLDEVSRGKTSRNQVTSRLFHASSDGPPSKSVSSIGLHRPVS